MCNPTETHNEYFCTGVKPEEVLNGHQYQAHRSLSLSHTYTHFNIYYLSFVKIKAAQVVQRIRLVGDFVIAGNGSPNECMCVFVCVEGSEIGGRDYMTHNVHVLLCALSVPVNRYTPLKSCL